MRPTLVILAGGKGTRLHSVTNDQVPKPMVDVFGKPFLYRLIGNYISQGFTDIIISTGHLAEVIEEYPWPEEWALTFVRDEDLNGGMDYWYEATSTHDDFITVNGDTFIPEGIPDAPGPWILAANGIDAGAQKPGIGKIKIIKTNNFYDIGDPDRLEDFKSYLYRMGKV